MFSQICLLPVTFVYLIFIPKQLCFFLSRYRHQVELVRFLNQFADPQMDMPPGWDKKVDQAGRVCVRRVFLTLKSNGRYGSVVVIAQDSGSKGLGSSPRVTAFYSLQHFASFHRGPICFREG